MAFRTSVSLFFVLLLAASGCLNLDGSVHNPRHCSQVGPQSCEEIEDPFSRICTPCDEEYDWSIDVPWPEGFFQTEQILRVPQVERRMIETSDGEGSLDTYWIPSHGEVEDYAEVTIVYNHGNYGSVEHFVPRMRILYELGFNILIWDYRGYGKSLPARAPETEAFLEDARQIRDLADELGPNREKVVVYGMSLGAVPSVEMVLSSQPCALILEVPFTSIQEISKTNVGISMPGSFLTTGYLENVDRIADYEGPLMILHGTDDPLFPIESVEVLYENAPGPKVMHIVEGARHGLGDGIPETAGFEEYARLLDEYFADQGSACLSGQ